MNDGLGKCPACGGQTDAKKNCCPHCGRWQMVRGISFYTFWTGLSLVVVALAADFFYAGFVVINRML
jgi:hypothetical protein